MDSTDATVVLNPGEFYRKRSFGPETVNRGAVLLECQWEGGAFESGMMLGGLFRSGEFLGGTFSGAAFLGGRWLGGTWLCGFDRDGRYRPRTDRPPHEGPSPAVAARTVGDEPGAGRLVIACPHRYPDLARLWFVSVARELVPAFRRRGLEIEMVLFCDAERFDSAQFPGARLVSPHPRARDFIEFYDAALEFACEYLLFLDADVFVLDGEWAAGHLALFDDPETAAVSLLSRPELPGSMYALLCRRASFLGLAPPVMAARYAHLDRWPDAGHRDPGEDALLRLETAGKRVVRADTEEAADHVADFHGTTNIRVSRELFGRAIGDEAFERLIAGHRYLARGACDNALLGAWYVALFGEPFAPGPDGTPLGGSLEPAAIRRALGRSHEPAFLATIRAHLDRSAGMVLRLAARDSLRPTLPGLWPDGLAAPVIAGR